MRQWRPQELDKIEIIIALTEELFPGIWQLKLTLHGQTTSMALIGAGRYSMKSE